MQELKFRAWVYYGERLRKPRYSDDDWLCRFFEDCKEDDIDENGKPQCIEQYTGLKDKNGKEIYEGDIVRTKSCDRANFNAGAIEMVQQMYLIMNSAHYRDPEISHCEPLGYYCDTELEVIGNIHENPEILKKLNKDY